MAKKSKPADDSPQPDREDPMYGASGTNTLARAQDPDPGSGEPDGPDQYAPGMPNGIELEREAQQREAAAAEPPQPQQTE